jgi:hypothetical protein
MRRYGSKKVPKGASTRNFALLSASDQKDSVRKLKASGLTNAAIAQLSGLSVHEVDDMLPFCLAAPKREGTTICRYCYFTPDKCICEGEPTHG